MYVREDIKKVAWFFFFFHDPFLFLPFSPRYHAVLQKGSSIYEPP